MKPVAIFRHSPTEGPGYFATFLENHGISWRLYCIDQNEAVPARCEEYSGLAFMGGPMSVNDPLPWIGQECALIRDAIDRNIPVIGHCLGGQLMSRALGGRVAGNPVKEIGWSRISAVPSLDFARWAEDIPGEQGHIAFQWHGETFSIPDGAQLLFRNEWCENQAFVLGPHLAMQFHVEMTEPMIADWCKAWAGEGPFPSPLPASIDDPQRMLSVSNERLPELRRLADRLYGTWILGLARR